MKTGNFLKQIWFDSKGEISNTDSTLPKELFDNQIGKIFSLGNYYYYILNFSNLPDVRMEYRNESLSRFFGVPPEEMSLELLMSRIHPDDIPFIKQAESFVLEAIHKKYKKNLLHFKNSYSFRVKDKNSTYKLIHHQSTIIKIDDKGNFSHSINVHTDISHITTVNPRTVSLFGFDGMPSYMGVDPYDGNFFESTPFFSEREAEIIRLFSSGYSSKEIASQLFISNHTVTTHRKNILAKANCNKMTEVVALSIKKGLI